MKRKRRLKRVLLVLMIGIGASVGVILYMYNMPHRDVQAAKTDYTLEAEELVRLYLQDAKKADALYLDEEGDSKIFEVLGVVKEISEDFNKQQVVLLEGVKDKAGVSCTFTKESNHQADKLHVGEKVKIKGIIRSGASYDEDLEMYENVIIEKVSIVN